jgi:hypothetical protein
MCLVAEVVSAATVRVTAERVNLRSSASTDSQVVVMVTKGTLLEMVGREGDWYRVLVPGSPGTAAYIHSAICEFSSAPTAAPAAVPQSAPAGAPAAAPYTPTSQAPAPAPAPRPVSAPSSDDSEEKPISFGVHGSLSTDYTVHDIGAGIRFGGGASLRLNNLAGVQGLGAMATFDYFLGKTVDGLYGYSVEYPSSLQIGAYATYSFTGEAFRPYVGAGFSYLRVDTPGAVDLGVLGAPGSLGLVGGARFGSHFFAEARYHFGYYAHLAASAGFLF